MSPAEMWTPQQRYCTACAASVFVGFAAWALYLDPTPSSRLLTRPFNWLAGINWTAEAVTAAATIALAFLTLVLALGTIFLWWATKRLVQGSEQTAVRQLRAYVFGKGFTAGPNMGDQGIVEYVVFQEFENVGLTPATGVQAWLYIQTFPVSQNCEPNFATKSIAPTGGGGALGPRSGAKTQFRTIPLATMMENWRRETEIFVWFRVEYRDIFDASILHHHERCTRVEIIRSPNLLLPQGHPSIINFLVYGKQNSTS